MANYKKLTDVEVMEEVSENSMALVNENGVLKQVPCGAGFGGGGGSIVIARNETTGVVSCETTYDEFVAMLNSGMLPTIICTVQSDSTITIHLYHCSSIWNNDGEYGLSFYNPSNDGSWFNLIWDAMGISEVNNSPA